MTYEKKEGFIGQLKIVVPKRVITDIELNPLINDLYITGIGYYPAAKYHYKKRKKGIKECILIYVISGKGTIEVNNNKYLISENNCFIIPKLVPHKYYTDFKEPWSIYWIHFSGLKASLFNNIFNKVLKIKDSQALRTEERINLINDMIFNLSMGFNKDAVEYVNLGFSRLLSTFFYLEKYNSVFNLSNGDLMQNAIFFMQQNLDKNFKIKELAQQFKISPSYFSKMFKLRTHYSPIDYFINLKMHNACQLLEFSNMKISEISRELGYNDPFYFSRIFKKTMKVSPKYYREKNK